MIELDELCSRFQQGHTMSQMARSLGQSRQTIRKYLNMAYEAGLTRGGDEAERLCVLAILRQRLTPATSVESAPAQKHLEPYRDQISAWLSEPDMTMKQI